MFYFGTSALLHSAASTFGIVSRLVNASVGANR
jgi:hypothetical protein